MPLPSTSTCAGLLALAALAASATAQRTWLQIPTENAPPDRSWSDVAYDLARDELVLFAGVEPNAAFTSEGFNGGLIAGLITTAGAWGIVFGNRFVTGGPSVVMPLTFAGAPVVNSFYVMWATGTPWSAVDPRFWLGLLVVAVGGYLVLTNKPEAKH